MVQVFTISKTIHSESRQFEIFTVATLNNNMCDLKNIRY